MTNEELLELGKQIYRYIQKFYIPLEYLLEILEDQKVVPMIRGKAMEYNAYLYLKAHLPRMSWDVQKLNLNAQTGIHDEDISITHRKSGIILKVESKSAVRGSIRDGKGRSKTKTAGFYVKCHRSRSNIKLAETTNDRYSVDSFDVLITNPANAIYEGGTIGDDLEIVHKTGLKEMLYAFYKVTTTDDLKLSCESDWRFIIPRDIAEEGFIPRTPFVALENDPRWFSIDKLEARLLDVVNAKNAAQKRTHSARRWS